MTAGSLYEHGRAGLVIDYPKAGRLYDTACELGDADGCGNVGFLTLLGLGRDEDVEKAQELFEASCAKKSGAGCYGMALLAFDSRVGASSDLAQGLAYEQKACDLGELQACSDLGTWYRGGTGVEQDLKKAHALFERACTDDVHFGCEHLAWAQVDGEGEFTADPKAGFAEMSRLCKLPSPAACGSLGTMFHHGIGTEQDLAKARETYAYACEHGQVHACGDVGDMMVLSQGGEKDVDAGMVLLDKACIRGSGAACHIVGKIYGNGAVVEQDLGKAELYVSTACEQGYLRACTDLGFFQSTELAEKPADPKKAMLAFEKACEGGEAKGCEAAGNLLRNDEPARARGLYAKACEAKLPAACDALATMLEDAQGGPVDLGKARALYEAACDEGMPSACAKLAETHLDTKRPLAERQKGAELLEKMCAKAKPAGEDEKGWPNRHACSMLARHYMRGRVLTSDQPKAIELYQRACDLDEPTVCRSLGVDFANGRTLPTNPHKALELLERACELRESDCLDYAKWLIELPSPPGDVDAGVEVLDEACSASDNSACSRLASLYDRSNNLPQDLVKSVEYSEKACGSEPKHSILSRTVGRACHQAATTRRQAPEAELRDWEKIVELYQRACTLDYSRGCDELADLYQGGAGTEFEKNPKLAKAYRAKACKEGSRRSCTHEGH